MPLLVVEVSGRRAEAAALSLLCRSGRPGPGEEIWALCDLAGGASETVRAAAVTRAAGSRATLLRIVVAPGPEPEAMQRRLVDGIADRLRSRGYAGLTVSGRDLTL